MSPPNTTPPQIEHRSVTPPKSKLRGARLVAIFIVGALVGAFASSLPGRDPGPVAVAGSLPLAVAESETAKVNGGSERSARAVATEADVSPARMLAEEPAPARAAFSGRTVAGTALSVTASVKGNGVFGAGIVIGARHVLTCLHVVDDMRSIQVSIAEGANEPAKIVERDAALDLAVLELETPRSQHASLGSAAGMQMGDRVFAMGAPKNLMFSLNSGIVSYVGRRYSDVYYLQTDIPTNSGSSGGPVLDERGRVIALSSFILRGSQGLSFALPIDYAYQRFARYFADRLNVQTFESWLATRQKAEPSRRAAARHPARGAADAPPSPAAVQPASE